VRTRRGSRMSCGRLPPGRREDPPPSGRLAPPVPQAASATGAGSIHVRSLWPGGPDARLQERPDRLSEANPERTWGWAGPASSRRFPARAVARLASSKGALPQNPARERPETRENGPFPSWPIPANIVAWLVSSKSNSPSPAQRRVPAGAQKANSCYQFLSLDSWPAGSAKA